MNRASVVCVVLAAGRSSRMGHAKALTRIGHETALERVVRVAAAAGVPDRVVVVVAEPHAEVVRAAHPHLDVEWVLNPSPEQGRTGSLKRGLARVETAARVLVWPVDHPLARLDTVRRLLDASSDVVLPEQGGRGGHPLVLAGAALAEARALADDAPLRDVVRRDPGRVARVVVDDEGVRANLDTPEDLEPLHRDRGRSGSARD